MENFNALLTLSELKTLYSGKPVGICPLYKGTIDGTKSFEATGNPIVLPEYKSLVKLTTQFSPKQAGTGDPSPENVRPISGWDEVTVNVRGKNLLDYSGEIIIPQDKYQLDCIGEEFITALNRLPRNTPLVMSANWSYISESGAYKRITVIYHDSTYTVLNDGASKTIEDKEIVRAWIYAGTNKTQDCIVSDIQFEVGSTPTPYEPYQPGTTATLTLPETIYGGTVDAVTGAGSKTWGFIASYNGEALPGEWISDRDVYASGTTPTTGAQVAYKLATPEYFKVSQVSIPSLRGENTFFTNGENMDIIYKETSFWG